MILPFVVDPAVFHDYPGETPDQRRHHQYLLQTWAELGVLVLEAEAPFSEIWQVIEQLPQGLRRKWKEMLSSHLYRQAPKKWQGFRRGGLGHLAELAGLVELAALGEAMADRAGIPAEETAVHPGSQVELARLPDLLAAKIIHHARARLQQEIPEKTPTRKVWERWLMPHAHLAQQATVVDRYAGVRLARRRLNHPPDKGSGLERFLRYLASVPSQRKVVIITGDGGPRDGVEAADILEALRHAVRSTKWKVGDNLELFVIDENHFGQVYHDRYVRFGSTRVILGTGLEVLEGDRLGKPVAYSFLRRRGAEKRYWTRLESRLKEGVVLTMRHSS